MPMKLSAPIYRLRRIAKLLSRKEGIPLHAALDRVAAGEGFRSWSLLAARASEQAPARTLFARLRPGDLVLIGARPGHGKTLMSLALAVEAMRRGHRGIVFTLEETERDVSDRFRAIGVERAQFAALFEVDCSDAISAAYIARKMAAAEPGTLIVVDYLQLLDQRRDNAALSLQVAQLKALAAERDLIVVCISQIDRSYDARVKRCPDLDDVRLPNPADLGLFDKACFLNDGEVRFREAC